MNDVPREDVYDQYRKFIYYILKPYRLFKSPRYDYDDIEQVAWLAFLDARKIWDPDKGELTTIAAEYIRGRVRTFINKNQSEFSCGHKEEYDIPSTRSLDEEMAEDLPRSEVTGKLEDQYSLVEWCTAARQLAQKDKYYDWWYRHCILDETYQSIADDAGVARQWVWEKIKSINKQF